jgi:hypothetical protein
MVEEIEHPSVYSQLATPALLKSALFVIMLDFTAPWNFVQEIEKWVRFIKDLQQMAQLSIADLEQMAARSIPSLMQLNAGINSSESRSLTSRGSCGNSDGMQCSFGIRERARRGVIAAAPGRSTGAEHSSPSRDLR